MKTADPLTPDETRRRNILLGVFAALTVILAVFVVWTSYQQAQNQRHFQEIIDRQAALIAQQSEPNTEHSKERHDLLCAHETTQRLVIAAIDTFVATTPDSTDPARENLRRTRDEAKAFSQSHPDDCR